MLAALPQLDTLNLGGNAITSLAGLAGCTELRTLVACDNSLASADALSALASCTQLESVDLQNNKLEDGPALLGLLKGLPHLKCLYLRGNPLVSSLPRWAVAAAWRVGRQVWRAARMGRSRQLRFADGNDPCPLAFM